MDRLRKQKRLQLAIEAFNSNDQIRKIARQYDVAAITFYDRLKDDATYQIPHQQYQKLKPEQEKPLAR